MPPRAATRIIKEYKTAEEQERINRVLERVRQGGGTPTSNPTNGEATGGGVAGAPARLPAGADGAAAASPRE
jgi:hypothetical protein